jgi:hypothetical protein
MNFTGVIEIGTSGCLKAENAMRPEDQPMLHHSSTPILLDTNKRLFLTTY